MLMRQVTAKLVITVSPTFFLRTIAPSNRPSPGIVIIRTSATEVSIQAVSPELGVQFSSTANLGSGLPAQAGAASAVGAAAAPSAYEWSITDRFRNRAKRAPNARARSPAPVGFLNVIGLTPVARRVGAGSQSAAASVSPVRMRTAASMARTKIFPAPI